MRVRDSRTRRIVTTQVTRDLHAEIQAIVLVDNFSDVRVFCLEDLRV